MRLILLVFFMAVGLFANEVKVDGSYSNLLGNPFKSVLETKTQDISIVQGESKLIQLKVETNRNDFSFRQPELSVMSNSCNVILKSFVSEDYNVVSNNSKKVSCEILPSTTVKIDYVMKEDHSFVNQISDIIINLDISLNIDGQVMKLTNVMNKDLNKNGTSYGVSIRAIWNPDSSSINDNVQKIIEHSIYDILNKAMKGK